MTLYLNEISVRVTLRVLKSNVIEGSTIVTDIYSTSFIKGEYVRFMKPSLSILELTDEGLGFGINMGKEWENSLEKFITSENLKSGESYFMGYKNKKDPLMVVTEVHI